MYDSYTPTPVTAMDSVGEPLLALETMALGPATFAPSVAVPMPDGECNDPVGAFVQVGTRRLKWYSWCAFVWVLGSKDVFTCGKLTGGKRSLVHSTAPCLRTLDPKKSQATGVPYICTRRG